MAKHTFKFDRVAQARLDSLSRSRGQDVGGVIDDALKILEHLEKRAREDAVVGFRDKRTGEFTNFDFSPGW